MILSLFTIPPNVVKKRKSFLSKFYENQVVGFLSNQIELLNK